MTYRYNHNIIGGIFSALKIVFVLPIHFLLQPQNIILFLFLCFVERGGRREKERERNIEAREKHQSAASHM